jgi:hypothetical protein
MKDMKKEVGEVQSTLNKKNGSKPSRTIDFASRFILLIKSNLKFILSIIITNINAKSTVIKGFEPPLPPMKK